MTSDFHLHTTVSDGELDPVELLRHAASHGVTDLAITDHDTLEAYRWEDGAVFVEAERLSLALTVGIEIDAELDGIEVHLLGFGLDPRDADLCAHTRCVEEARIERAHAEIRIVNGLLGRDAILAEDIFVPGRRTLMKPHFIRPLLRRGLFETYEAASAWFEVHVRGCGVDVPRPPLPDVIALVQAAGGWTALAHPGNYHKAGYPVAERLPVLRGMGLEGIELEYPYRRRAPHRWSAEDERALLAELGGAAEALGLRTTRGSDCHTVADFEKIYG